MNLVDIIVNRRMKCSIGGKKRKREKQKPCKYIYFLANEAFLMLGRDKNHNKKK